MNRRKLVTKSSAVMAATTVGLPLHANLRSKTMIQKINIRNVNSNFERENVFPYHFKGGAVTQLWQTAAWLQSDQGNAKIGLCTQSPLWSDASVAGVHSENGANAIMFAITERAVQMVKGISFTDPIELQEAILPELFMYAKEITRNPDLKKTFVLNALVSVDNAAWLLYAQENKLKTFDEMVPLSYREGLSFRHQKVASVPSFSVGTDIQKVKSAAEEGYFIIKLKIGSKGNQKVMLKKDMEFLSAVHSSIGHLETPYTKSGKIPYYMDCNGRYESKETLLRFLDHAKKIGAFDQIAVIEEPLGETDESFVGDVGVAIAADESAHTVAEATKRMEQGYKTIVVKAIAKTLSMTLKIIKASYNNKVPLFCADLTVNPILVDWNKSIAARLAPLPNIEIGLLETNGHQYYKDWNTLQSYHPVAGAEWTKVNNGVFNTDLSFYNQSGGIFLPSEHYGRLFAAQRD